MEKVLSIEDRIKRAEEIYNRRNNVNSVKKTAVNLNSKKEYKLLKKVLIQILVCSTIYGIIYLMQVSTNSFSVDSISYIKKTMVYDVDFNKWINDFKNNFAFLNRQKEDKKEKQEEKSKEEVEGNNSQEGTLAVSAEQKDSTSEVTEEKTDVLEENASGISQMEEDAKYIKENFSLIKPVTGEITSRFGIRNPTTVTVPVYHTGIDIGVDEGTVFVSAMDGTVELVSSVGDYRKSHKDIKWRCNDFICTFKDNICKRRR